MRPPAKRDKIVNEFKARILSGVAAPGSRMPTEQELAHRLNVARDTLRDALRILEEEQLIERIPGKGTFIRAQEKEQGNVITFLLPCADIIADRIGYRTSLITREMLCGAMIEGNKQKLRIETIAVSPTNRNDDIDWHSLSHLNESGKVIVFTLWYQPLFQFLKERGTSVALVTLGNENRCCGCREFTDRWIHLHDDISAVMREADHFLRTEYECGKTCIITRNYTGEDQGSFDLSLNAPCPEIVFFTRKEHDRKYREELNALYRRHRFDGLFLQVPYLHRFDYSRTLNENLGLPEKVRLLTYCETPYSTRLPQRVPSINFNFRELGAEAVRRLKNFTGKPVDYAIKPFIDSFQ